MLEQPIKGIFNLLICIWMIRLQCSIQAVKLAASLIFLIRPLFYSIYIRKHYSIDRKIQYDQEPIAQKWNGIAQHVSAVVLDGTDNIVLTLFSTLSNVSVYSVYYMIIGSIQGFYQSAAVGLQSAAGAMWAKQDQVKIRQMFATVEFGLHTVTIFLFSCTGILIVPFVQVYTNGLTDANYIQPVFAALLVLGYGIRCLRTPYNIWILAAGHFKQTQRCHITAAALNLSLSVFAVSRWGLIGVAVGTLIAMCYQTFWMMFYVVNEMIEQMAPKTDSVQSEVPVFVERPAEGDTFYNLEIVTPYCTMYYPARWNSSVHYEHDDSQEDIYKVHIYSRISGLENQLLFSIYFGGDEGDQLGAVMNSEGIPVPVNLLLNQLALDGLNEDDMELLCAMQEASNELVEKLPLLP